MSRPIRAIALACASVAALLLLVPAAMAADGVGVWGRTDDKVVTYAGFILIVFFAVLVIGLSYIQGRLDSRKERAKRDLERLAPGPRA
jgi:preprotein translocase subunit SecG